VEFAFSSNSYRISFCTKKGIMHPLKKKAYYSILKVDLAFISLPLIFIKIKK